MKWTIRIFRFDVKAVEVNVRACGMGFKLDRGGKFRMQMFTHIVKLEVLETAVSGLMEQHHNRHAL